jgi:nucleoside-triphosphatase
MPLKNIFLTGKPRSGKTTMVMRIVQQLDSAGGFFTQEFCRNNQRIGFKITTLAGREGILAKKGFRSRFRLGKYGINLRDLESIGVAAIEEAVKKKEVVVIDEIGKMELFSLKFRNAVLQALDSKRRVLGTIQQSDLPFLKQIRLRRDTTILELESFNREEIFKHLKEIFNYG